MNRGVKNSEVFFSELVHFFPQLREAIFDEDFIGITSLQMGVFTRFTQDAIDCENRIDLAKCFEFIDHEIGNVTAETENSIVLSYLGKLNFTKNPGAKRRLPARLSKIIDELELYYTSQSKKVAELKYLK